MWEMISGARVSRLFLVCLCLVVSALVIGMPVAAQKTPTSVLGVQCARASELGLEKMMNVRAHWILIGCGLEEAQPGVAERIRSLSEANLTGEVVAPTTNVNTITGETAADFPNVTQSESMVWSSDGNTIVVNYNDSKDRNASPINLSGVSVSTDAGGTFTRLRPAPFATGHGANFGDPIVVHNAALGMWFAGDLVGGCGAQGIGLWTSTTGTTWVPGTCAHSGGADDRESMWVDNNPGSAFFGRMYISWNDFAAGARIFVTHSDEGMLWSTPVPLTAGFIRNVQLTGSLEADGTVFVAGMNEGPNGRLDPRTNIMFRSIDGGNTWTQIIMGPPFNPPGETGCNYFARIPPIWRHMGWGQPAVGPGGVVHYAFAGRGLNTGDTGDIYYTRSLDNGDTWSPPIVLNTDQAGGGTRVQWMPSLSVNADGQVVVGWYDRRNSTDGTNYEFLGIASPDNGETWGSDEPISDVLIPQPEQPDPGIQPCYAGDYNYHTAFGNTAYMTWTDGRVSLNGHFQQDVFFAAVPLGAATGLQGQVTSAASGDPIAVARVRAVGPVDRAASTNATGNYTLRLPAGAYDVTASAFGFLAQTAPAVQVDEGETTTQDFPLQAAPAHRVSGTVTSASNGTPIANAEVRILNTPIAPVMTDNNGAYEFPAVPDGTYSIRAGGAGRCLGSLTREVTFDADVVVDFALQRRVDGFGYACDDNVTFNWTPGDVLLDLIGDDASMTIALPFPFPAYGTTNSMVHISTNGNINFFAPNASFVNICIPDPNAIRGIVAPFWDDLLVGIGGAGRIWTKLQGNAPNREFIIEYRDVTFFAGAGVATFEVILRETSGDITFQYNRTDAQGDGRSATIGIQNNAGTIGLQYSCNEAAVSVGKAIRFFRP